MQGFNVVIDWPIAWGDMDAFAHVNNTVFFRLFESARMAYLTRINFSGAQAAAGPILAETQCRFRRPISYPDTVQVGARVTSVAHDRFTMEYRIVRGDGNLAADGSGLIVAFDYAAGSKIPIPDEVRAAIRRLDGV
ncbi:MAG TPA: thioesterase family protein [Longimicrobiales bacterium]